MSSPQGPLEVYIWLTMPEQKRQKRSAGAEIEKQYMQNDINIKREQTARNTVQEHTNRNILLEQNDKNTGQQQNDMSTVPKHSDGKAGLGQRVAKTANYIFKNQRRSRMIYKNT
jgi:hypothetical protein